MRRSLYKEIVGVKSERRQSFHTPYCTTSDPFFLVRTRILRLIEILIQFQVGELRNAWISTVWRSKTDHLYNVFEAFSENAHFKNIVFLRNHQIFRYEVKVFASQTLYRWSFPDVGNGRAGREFN